VSSLLISFFPKMAEVRKRAKKLLQYSFLIEGIKAFWEIP
jgi:hypothetical protein